MVEADGHCKVSLDGSWLEEKEEVKETCISEKVLLTWTPDMGGACLNPSRACRMANLLSLSGFAE